MTTAAPGFETVLVVDDEEGLREWLGVLLTKEGFETTLASGGTEGLETIRQGGYDLVLCDIRMPGPSGFEVLEAARALPNAPVFIMMSAYGDRDTALETIRGGAWDFIAKPFKREEVLFVIRKAAELRKALHENRRLREEINQKFGLENMIGESEVMRRLFDMVRKVAAYKTSVLVTGESGTGKELVARAIHQLSPRADKAFVAINCGAIPENLLESELFGHVRGAFTGAESNKAGLFEEADRGTIFLDEIGELPQALQVKLLRVLQEEEIRRVGDTKSRKIDVRVVAATVRDLEKEVAAGTFREDLFFRLNVFHLKIPALRERREDIPVLVEFLLRRLGTRLGRPTSAVSQAALDSLLAHEWRGNVRELENVLERALVFTEGDTVTADDLPANVTKQETRVGELPGPAAVIMGNDLSIKRASRRLEYELIKRALQKTGGNRTRAAKLLDISHRALLYKITDLGLGEVGKERDKPAAES